MNSPTATLSVNTPTCPPAPKKIKVEKERNVDDIPKLELPSLTEQEELEMIYVRWKYLMYNKEDVSKEDDISLLHDIRRWYSPWSQPRKEVGWKYVFGVLAAAEERLRQLKCDCSSCESLWDNISTEELLNYL